MRLKDILAAFLGRRKHAARIAALDERLAVVEWIGLDLSSKLDFVLTAMAKLVDDADLQSEPGVTPLWAA
jgi:hypothetical protein